MKLIVIETTWGGFIVHSPTCPIIERDDNVHGSGMFIEAESDHRYSLVQEVHELLESSQDLRLYGKRFIYHSLTVDKKDVCVAERLPQ